ncbi:MAG: hypothetical protein NUW01_18590 [Gemmatimonadaceae bacterium]|nr:hypothetical protein [Gemmatimonadaceae bacterium]
MSKTIRIPVGPSGKPVAWTTVDASDYERLIIHRWYLSGRGYPFRPSDGGVFIHREVLDFPDSDDIHNINGDKLDNRRANLEACTHAHNVQLGARATVRPLRERICELRLDGWFNDAIADELGISTASVVKYAKHLPKAPQPDKMKWTPERLIEVVRRFHAEHGRVPSQAEFDGKNGMPWFTTVYRRFPGGVLDLREAAGFGRVDFRSAA